MKTEIPLDIKCIMYVCTSEEKKHKCTKKASKNLLSIFMNVILAISINGKVL